MFFFEYLQECWCWLSSQPVSYLGSSRTWLLRINTNGIAAKIEGAAQLKISQMLPGYIESVKGSVPELVANRAANQFGDLKFTLGGEEFALPRNLSAVWKPIIAPV